MTIRTQVIPDVGAKTPVPALEPLLFELARPGRSGRHVTSKDAPEIPETGAPFVSAVVVSAAYVAFSVTPE